ncbi:hypothetical protein H4R18_002966 [Coemansia javaensis]|uniref:pyridoxal 5'-phosphate synthase (glutamine hydrolyzing) n=1 Tax=Coemansia javaensis TaxID=2761396 RepID=A0A9W8LI06_9FUNG|nr:hypothetical protein H4R18_002966 [Coemansia javaensis]
MSTPAEKEKQEKQEKNLAKKVQLMRAFEGGVIVIVHTVAQALLAERCGASGLIVVGRTTYQNVKKNGKVARAPDPLQVKDVMDNVMLPAIARVSIGHEVEARVMQSSFVNGIDESELLGQADPEKFDYHKLDIPVIVCVESFDDVVQAIYAGAAALRPKVKGANGLSLETAEDTPHIVQNTVVLDTIRANIREYKKLRRDGKLKEKETKLNVPVKSIEEVMDNGIRLPFFAHGGIIHPVDAAFLMSSGYKGVIVSVQVFQCKNPEKRIRSLVLATKHYKDNDLIAKLADDHGTSEAVA